jgi:hypothetical protein
MFKESLGRVSFTSDIWTDTNLSPFMAVTAHWIKGDVQHTTNGLYNLTLQADLVGFIHLPGNHTGEHIAYAFVHVLERIKVTTKVRLCNQCAYPILTTI